MHAEEAAQVHTIAADVQHFMDKSQKFETSKTHDDDVDGEGWFKMENAIRSVHSAYFTFFCGPWILRCCWHPTSKWKSRSRPYELSQSLGNRRNNMNW